MASVTFDQAQCWYPGADGPVVHGLDLTVEDGEFMVLVGPSGSGKSTTLRMLAGLEPLRSGSIFIGDRDVTTAQPADRDIAMVFQNYALYPHMTVADNMGFALKVAGVSRADRRGRIEEAARMLGLDGLLDRKPRALSGGQRQRVAMGRAIVRQPQVFCLDEPLSNLDAKMRVQTRADIARIQGEVGATMLYVTHDQVEAMTLGDRVAVLDDGRIKQVGTPLDLYQRPENLMVAAFIGSPSMNLFSGVVGDQGLTVGDRWVGLPAAPGPSGRAVVVGVRPEDWTLAGPDSGLRVVVDVVEQLGSDSFVRGTFVDGGREQSVTVRRPPTENHRRGDVLDVTPEPAAVHLFDAESGLRLGD